MSMIVFIQSKGGVAKTTSSVLVATGVARTAPNLSVGFCDLDSNTAATRWLTDHPMSNIRLVASPREEDCEGIDVVFVDTEGKSQVEQVLAVLPPKPGLFIVPCGPDTAEVEGAEKTIKAIRAKWPKANVRLLWTRTFTGRSARSDPDRLKQLSTRLGVEPIRQRIDHSTLYGAARDEGWAALSSRCRQAIESVAVEVLTSMAKK